MTSRDADKKLFVSFCFLRFGRRVFLGAADDPAKKMLARPDRENHDTSLLVLTDSFGRNQSSRIHASAMYGIFAYTFTIFSGVKFLYEMARSRLSAFEAVMIDKD